MKSFNIFWVKLKNTNPLALYIDIIVWSTLLMLLFPFVVRVYALASEAFAVESMPISAIVQIALNIGVFSLVYLGSMFLMYKAYKWAKRKIAQWYEAAISNLTEAVGRKKGELFKRFKKEV